MNVYVAAETFTTEIDGLGVKVRKDRARVMAGHSLLESHADSFVPLPAPDSSLDTSAVVTRRFGLFEHAGIMSLAGAFQDGVLSLTHQAQHDRCEDFHPGDRHDAGAPVVRAFPEFFGSAPARDV